MALRAEEGGRGERLPAAASGTGRLRRLVAHLSPPQPRQTTLRRQEWGVSGASSSAAWECALELGRGQSVLAGDATALAEAVALGSDVKIRELFTHRQHVDPAASFDDEIIEVAQLGVALLIRPPGAPPFVAALQNLRQPIVPPDAFGPRPSLSLFLLSCDGQQAMARLFLDAATVCTRPSPISAPAP